jgi:signal transduction histidine kinase
MASHQLRTPLTTIRWYSDKLLRKGDNLNEKQIEWTKAVYETAVQLAELVDGLLNISRIERGKIEPQPKLGSISALLQSCVDELKLHAEKKVITLECNFQAVPDFMFDADLIHQVQLNLLSNAIKYTPENGKITISLSIKETNVLVEVHDTGIGIPLIDQDKIFQRFYRASNAAQNSTEGTGLGLTFAKMIVEKSGGEMKFISNEGQGSTFSYTLPLKTMTE